MKRKDLFIIFTDIDKTFLPPDGNFDVEAIIELSQFIKDVMSRDGNIEFKLCPVTGRHFGYTKALMENINKAFAKNGLQNITEIGACEQGSILVSLKESNNFDPKVIETKKLSAADYNTIQSSIKNALPSKYFEEHAGKRYSTFFYCLKEAYLSTLSNESISKVLDKAKSNLLQEFQEQGLKIRPDVLTIANRYIEVSPLGYNKDNAIKHIFYDYLRNYNIRGMSFSGDSINDLAAVKLMTKLAEIPGIKAHVFLPANARECVCNQDIEAWKDNNTKLINGRVIQKGTFNYFKGVTECIKKSYKENNLLEKSKNRDNSNKVISLRRSKSEPILSPEAL